MSTTTFSDFSSSPQLNIIDSKQERRSKGISAGYVGTYNEAELAKYNNEYNYWLWQQQANYNDPINQVARMKAAGLNPNYNSIDGTGNLTSMPTSNSSIRSNPVSDTASLVNIGINGFNSLLRGISEGINSYSKIANTPSLGDIKGYRDALTRTMRSNSKYAEKRADYQEIETLFNGLISGYDANNLEGASSVSGGMRAEKLDKALGLQDKTAALLEVKETIGMIEGALKQAQVDRLEKMTPIEIEKLQENIKNTRIGTALRASELDWKAFSKTAGPIVNALKLFLR